MKLKPEQYGGNNNNIESKEVALVHSLREEAFRILQSNCNLQEYISVKTQKISFHISIFNTYLILILLDTSLLLFVKHQSIFRQNKLWKSYTARYKTYMHV